MRVSWLLTGLLALIAPLHAAASGPEIGRSIYDALRDLSRPPIGNAIAGHAPVVADFVLDSLNYGRLASRVAAVKPDLLSTRGPRESKLYASTSPAVVLIVTKDGLGSGSLLDAHGTILTNWHVIDGNTEVGIIFKPPMEGARVSRADVYRATVVGVNRRADLALLKSQGVGPQARPLTLGSMQGVSVGADVHAIGHPTGEAWTYTKGIISQIRNKYEWSTTGTLRHQADVIQTQTPINPGNSGGPLLDDEGRLIGVNSFKTAGEGLNFAITVDEVKRFLASPRADSEQRPAITAATPPACKPREIKRGRSSDRRADEFVYDIKCSGKPDALLTVPDDLTQPITLAIDSTGNGSADRIYIDTDRDGKWDISLYDTDGDGAPDLIGYHRDGNIKPYRLERYAAR